MSDFAGDNSKPRVVVLGGCGFIGRNLVEYLISNDLVSGLRVVDKTPPQLAFLNPTHSKVFEDSRVEYKSSNLINPTSCASALDPGDGSEWGLVVNCAGETRVGQTEAVYSEGIYTLSSNVAKQCANLKVPRLVEISSGQMYSSDKPHKEDGPIDPWTTEARMKYKVEQELKGMASELNYTIIRPAIVYGIGDRRSLTPRLLYGGIYKHLNETMKLLWTADLKMNTVHVLDVCRAIWTLGTKPEANRQTYNVVDEGNTTQGMLAEIVAEIFKINHDYYGTAISTLAKTDIASVSEEANDKHLTAWADICRRYSLSHTPLEPSAGPELLLNKQLCLDGTRLRTVTALHVPIPTVHYLKQLEDCLDELKSVTKYTTQKGVVKFKDCASVSEEANDKHLTAWADICRRYSLSHTPLEPSAGPELLLNKQLCLDGTRLRTVTATALHVPIPTVHYLKQVLEDYASMNLFPKELLL